MFNIKRQPRTDLIGFKHQYFHAKINCNIWLLKLLTSWEWVVGLHLQLFTCYRVRTIQLKCPGSCTTLGKMTRETHWLHHIDRPAMQQVAARSQQNGGADLRCVFGVIHHMNMLQNNIIDSYTPSHFFSIRNFLKNLTNFQERIHNSRRSVDLYGTRCSTAGWNFARKDSSWDIVIFYNLYWFRRVWTNQMPSRADRTKRTAPIFFDK